MLLLAVIPQPESLDLQIARISVAFASSRLLYMSFYLRLQSFYLRLQEAACSLQVTFIYICIAHLHLHQQGSNFSEFGHTQFCVACGNKLAFALYVESPHMSPLCSFTPLICTQGSRLRGLRLQPHPRKPHVCLGATVTGPRVAVRRDS